MSLFIFRFWPVLIPLLAYWLWLILVRRKAEKTGLPKPGFRDGPWYWAVLASLLTGVGCFIYVVTTVEGGRGTYVPPHLEGERLIPGQVRP